MTTTTTTTTRPFPFVNDWRRGCWVARPTGKPDRDWVYDREFLRGATHKTSGMVRYSLDDLGGPGFIVAKDARRIRSVIRVTDIGWEDLGELPARHILAVVQAGAWTGERCPDCGVAPLLEGDGQRCEECAVDAVKGERAAAHLATIADDEAPF